MVPTEGDAKTPEVGAGPPLLSEFLTEPSCGQVRSGSQPWTMVYA